MSLNEKQKFLLGEIMKLPIEELIAASFGIVDAMEWLRDNPAYYAAVESFLDRIDASGGQYLDSLG